MRRRPSSLARGLALGLAGLLSLWGGCAPAIDSERESVHEVPTPAGSGSGMSNLVMGEDGVLYLSWLEPAGGGNHSLRFAAWHGKEWSDPKTIATGDNFFRNWADFPSLAASADGTLAAHWLVKVGPGTYAYAVYVSVSRDHGRTWSRPMVPHRDETETEHGFVSIRPTSEGSFDLVWLDGRETVTDKEEGGFAVQSGGAMTLRHASLDVSGAVGPDELVDERVCDCCPTDAARSGDGTLLVVYRDRSQAEIRDISLRRLEGENWTPASPVHRDAWEVFGCPVNGPALDARENRVASAWFTMAREEAKVQVAFSKDAGKTFGDPLRVDDGAPVGRVDLVQLEDGSALISWIEEIEKGAEIRIRRVEPSGRVHPSLAVAPTSRSRGSGMPRMARQGQRVFVTWTQTDDPPGIRVAIVPISLIAT